MKTNCVVRVPTKVDWIRVVKHCLENGVRWITGNTETIEYKWDDYRSETCVCVEDGELWYSPLSRYQVEYPSLPIYTADEFLGEEMWTVRPEAEAVAKGEYWTRLMQSFINLHPSAEQNKAEGTIMQTLTGKIKRLFKPELQKQYKAGLINECGYLTPKGKEEMDLILREMCEEALVERAEEIISEEKEEK